MEHPNASFVTPEGVLVGPAVIHTAKEADARAREIRAELQVVAHDLAATLNNLKPRKERLAEIGGEIEFLRRADRGCRHRDHRRRRAHDASWSATSPACARKRSCCSSASPRWTSRSPSRVSGSRRWDPSSAEEMPELPALAQPPVAARVAVETLRRDRASHDARLAQLRTERDELAAHDPVQLRAELEAAETARAEAEPPSLPREAAARRATAARDAAAEAERTAAEAEAAVNKAWRDASTELDRLRETYEEEDRLRGDIERRIREAERLDPRRSPGRSAPSCWPRSPTRTRSRRWRSAPNWCSGGSRCSAA